MPKLGIKPGAILAVKALGSPPGPAAPNIVLLKSQALLDAVASGCIIFSNPKPTGFIIAFKSSKPTNPAPASPASLLNPGGNIPLNAPAPKPPPKPPPPPPAKPPPPPPRACRNGPGTLPVIIVPGQFIIVWGPSIPC